MFEFLKKNKNVTVNRKEYAQLAMKAALYADSLTRGKLGNAQWTKYNGAILADEGYRLNSIVYTCINRIARMFSSIQFEVVNKQGELVEDHSLTNLLERPNARLSGSSFLETYAVYYWLFGNGYIDATVFNKREITELHIPKSFRMKAVPGKGGYAIRYDYEQNGGKQSWYFEPNGKPDLTMSDDHMLLHSATVNPLDDGDWYGMPPLEAAGYSVDQHNEYSKHNKALAENGMSPTGIFTYEPPVESGLDPQMPEEMYNNLKNMIKDNHKGGANAGKELILEGYLKYMSTGFSPREGDFNETKLNIAREICAVFGVPFVLVVPGQSTYNNVKEAKLELALETVLPFARKFASDFNNFIKPVYPDHKIRPVETSIPSVRESAVDLAVKVDGVQHMTINEKRKLTQLSEVNGGDEVLINAGLLPLNFEADDAE